RDALTASPPSLPPARLVGACVAMSAALTLLRFGTSPGLVFAVLYLAPITFFTWFIGFRSGITTAFSSALLLLLFDLSHGVRAHPYWDTLMNTGMFVFIVFFLSEMKLLYQRERD